ncbi:MAG: SDR family oxidoreductase [Pseudomonadota bacterium]
MSDARVVVVTGAAGALGSAVVEAFAAQGDRIAQLDVIEPNNGHWSTCCDLTDAAATSAAFDQLREHFGTINVLANIAGGFAMGEAVHETGDDTWDFLFGLNARSILNTARAAVPTLLAGGGGAIINVGARGALRGAGQMGAYGAAKGVVHRLTEAQSDELRSQGINVNAVLPSLIDTPRNRADMPDADFSQWVRPESIAGVICFLASPAARDIHGALIPIDGLS